MVTHHSKHKSKNKEKNKREQHHTQQGPTIIHLHQLVSTNVVDTPKLRDGELDQLLEALTKDVAVRNQSRKEQIEKLKSEQIEFLTKFSNLTHTVLLGANETDTNKPLERAY